MSESLEFSGDRQYLSLLWIDYKDFMNLTSSSHHALPRQDSGAHPGVPVDAADRLRAACVEAALEILDDPHGPDVDIREVARRIGKSRTAPYLCFGKEREGGGRAGLLAAAAARGFDMLAVRLEQQVEGGSSSVLHQAASSWVAFACDHPRLYRLMFGSEVAGRMHLEGLTAARWRVQTILQGDIKAAQATGAIGPGRSLEQAMMVWAMLHGVATLTLDGQLDLVDGRDRASGFADRAIALTLTALRPQADGERPPPS